MKITENWGKANSDPQRWRHRSIREYHDWQWDEGEGDPCYPHAQTKFSPDWSGFESDPFCTRSKQTTRGGALEHADSSRSFAPQKTQTCVCVLRSPWRGDSPVKTTPSFVRAQFLQDSRRGRHQDPRRAARPPALPVWQQQDPVKLEVPGQRHRRRCLWHQQDRGPEQLLSAGCARVPVCRALGSIPV